MNATQPDDPLIGQVFADRYRIERRLGAGGMGAVYVARQIAMDRLVALKVLSPQLAGTDQAARRFQREMQATARVEHQNTIRVHDFGESGGRLFLAMELLDGQTLTAAMREAGPMPLTRVVHIGAQMAKALGAAHQEGVVHRDLKPDNVMLLDRYGEHDFVKVLDFGIARIADPAETQLTEAGSLVGTPVYMSPEQSMGHEVDHRSDLYSLGVVLYHLVTGHVPFQDPTPLRVLFMHVQDPPRPPSEWLPGISPALEAVVLRLLHKDPGQRPQTAAEVVQLLQTCLPAGQQAEAMSGLAVHAAVTVDAAMTVDGDTMAGVVPQFVNAETVADTREAMTPKPLDTPRNVRRWPWLLGAAAVIAAAVVLATGRNPQSPRETVVQQAVASPLMDLNALDLLYVQAGEPVPPEACQCREPAVLARLTTAARALQQSVAGVSGPEITQAVAALQEAPGQPCAELDTWRARADLQAGRSVQAVTAAQRAVSACPKLAVAHHLAGKAYLVQGQTVEAEAAFHKAMEIAPDFTAPAFNLGLLAVARKDGAAAVALFEPLTRKEAERGDVWFGLGHALALTGKTAEAKAAWCKARDLGLQDAARLCIAP